MTANGAFPFVTLSMLNQCIGLDEGFGAIGTLVRPQSTVNERVAQQVIPLLEGLRAIGTLMGSLVTVRLAMAYEHVLFGKSFSTLVTLVGSFVRVTKHVCLEGMQPNELLSTETAAVWPIRPMQQSMAGESAGLREGSSTRLTP